MDRRRNEAFNRGVEVLFGSGNWHAAARELGVFADDTWAWTTGFEEVPMDRLLDLRRLLMRAWDYGDPEIRKAVADIDELL